ncbi:hypothetical protein M407DRAFT_204388 [Tulasnella calospora MUT 4182]|uniref:C3H1-type domain-containing protein n=1 Tax=Tulasnella calospora MUT 4182 TaxID=1051891 RepID=A0A0C3QKJ9_9AGAM|nr:hypothetical protein M407DRAFT_204388 [Tulasnella calospora MUT 4182]
MGVGSDADPVFEPVEEEVPAQRQGRCWYYQSRRGCRNGDACRFAHSEPKATANMGSFSTDHEKAWDTSQRESLDGICSPHEK